MKLRHLMSILMLLSVGALVAEPSRDTPQKATVCQLLADPAAWNHKLVQVTGFASHGFEDSGFSDPKCEIHSMGLWMTYGGHKLTQTPSTVNEIGADRTKSLVVERIPIPLKEDATFTRFDTLLHQLDSTGHFGATVHATVIARFFSGKLEHYPGGDYWSGYGHLGCCSLFVIQQVISVEEPPNQNLDRDGPPPYPDATVMTYLDHFDRGPSPLQLQRQAESGARAFAFTDPHRVALEALLTGTKTKDPNAFDLRTIISDAARITYDGSMRGSDLHYRIVVSRPAWLSFYAKDPQVVTWLVIRAISYDNKPLPKQ
jgi:hypothetical protein